MGDWPFTLIILAATVYAIIIYNRLVRDRQRCYAGWSDISVQLKRRHDLIPKLVEAVQQYASYEQTTLDVVTRLRTEAAALSGAAKQAELESKINQQLQSIFALQEAYPELKADQSFLQLQTQISEVENDIQFARRYYNGAVRNLNIRIDSFPDNLIARLFKFDPAEYFELEEVDR